MPVMVTPECGERWKRASSDRMAAMRGVAGSGRLAGLAPSDQQVTLRGGASSSDSVEPGSSWPWCGCFLQNNTVKSCLQKRSSGHLPRARPSQLRCLVLNSLSALQRGSWADQGRAGPTASSSSTCAATRSRLST